jgi:hypothetical protein
MAAQPVYLTGKKEAIAEFLDRFEVRNLILDWAVKKVP